MLRRVVCIALPQIRVEIASAASASVPASATSRLEGASASARSEAASASATSAGGPLAVVIARAGGAVETERDILRATKLAVVSPLARSRGARPGQTVAAARAKCFDLRVRVVREDEVRSALERVAEVAL